MPVLRIGVLGAARIVPSALIDPARRIDDVTVAAIAARDPRRAAEFAARHAISRVLPSYVDVMDADDIDAVYVALPNSLHAEWTLRALKAGKHVLCEKPMAVNEREAARILDAANASGLVVMEALHYPYHPLAARIQQILAADDLGPIRRVETVVSFPLRRFSDIRYSYELAGGAVMDAGCYALHAQRLFGPGEPEVTAAKALLLRRAGHPEVDRAMSIDLRFPGGAVGLARASLWSRTPADMTVRVTGERGELRARNFVLPQRGNRLTVSVNRRSLTEQVSGDTTYTYQIRAFAAAVQGAPANLTPPSESLHTTRLIDASYRAAGLPERGLVD
jgi:predicted dehydrogenase